MTSHTATVRIVTPIGTITLTADERHLLSLSIGGEGDELAPRVAHLLLREACAQISDWFAGTRQDFDLPLAPLPSARGNQLRAGITAIPYGETLTYGALAQKLGSAPRAVGQACMRNPFPLLIPCHRVTSASGPEHYSGGDGVRTKAWLIGFERREKVGYGEGWLF
jgi:methylated-DNA-[protein]-cysteine S-methyltransferase